MPTDDVTVEIIVHSRPAPIMAEPDNKNTVPLGLDRHFVDVSAAELEGEETTYDMW